MTARVERLTIKKFRGASTLLDLKFDSNARLVLVFGDNGAGKSTIVDALDFVCNESYGCLEDRSLAGRKQQHLASLGDAPADVEVSVDASGQTWTGRLSSTGPTTTGPAGRPVVAVLRRSQVLRVINEQPKQRYEALREFVGLPGIQRSEDSLRKALKERENRYDQAVLGKQQADEALQRLWREEGGPGAGAERWARARASEDRDALTTRIGSHNRLLSLFERAATYREVLSGALQENEAAGSDLRAAEAALGAAEGGGTVRAGALVDLLNDAKVLLADQDDPEACPLCESKERASGLKARLSLRLDELSRTVDLKQKVETARATAVRAGGALDQVAFSFVIGTRALALRLQSDPASAAEVPLDWTAFGTLLGPEPLVSEPGLVREAERLWGLMKERAALFAERRDADQRTLNQLTALRQHVATIDEKTAAAKSLQSVTKALRAILVVVEGQRKIYVESLLASVSTTVETMYAKVHPGENIGKVRFYLRPKVTGSLEFDGDFQGATGLPPQAYYSDSHLDTLGVCVFLALARQFKGGEAVVVLDDVVTSADGPHTDRFLRMLQDEIPNFAQIIVTTHYRPWKERYRHAPSNDVQLIELRSWSLAGGVRHARTTYILEDMAGLVGADPLDRQALASKAGILLEEVLDFLCKRYECSVPRRVEPAYTLGELSSSLTKLSKNLKVEAIPTGAVSATVTTSLEGLMTDATQWAWVRNQVGAHFSLPGMDISDTDVKAFGAASLALARSLICGQCGELPNRNRSGSYWECSCRSLRLHPLTRPGVTTGPPETVGQ